MHHTYLSGILMVKADQRARLTMKTLGSNQFGLSNAITGATAGYYLPLEGPGLALRRTNGILFPYTPNISFAQQVEYSSYELVHTNYQQNAYGKTRNPNIQVTGLFASQTPEEAAYTVGVMHFLRVVTKMNFGNNDQDAGTPPPVLEFSAYGAYNFYKVPVLVGSFNFVYEDGVDYVEIETNGDTVQIPTVMTIAIDLLPQYSPAKQNEFNMAEFASGEGYKKGFI